MNSPQNLFDAGSIFVDKELWPIERKAIKKLFSRLAETNPSRLNESVTTDGIAATVFRLASLRWAEVGAMLTVIGLPLSVIGIFNPTRLRFLLIIGLAIGLFVILSAWFSWQRQSKSRILKAQFQSTLAGEIET